jgi:hypothetical protein
MAELDIEVGRQIVVTFTREGEVVDRFYCTDGRLAWRLALVILATHGDELHGGDALTVTERRRPNLIEAGLG